MVVNPLMSSRQDLVDRAPIQANILAWVTLGSIVTSVASYGSRRPAVAPLADAPQSIAAPVMRIDVNSAGPDEWSLLPGIGPTRSQRIVEYRDRVGRFASIDEIENVSGVGVTTLRRISDWLLVAEPSTTASREASQGDPRR